MYLKSRDRPAQAGRISARGGGRSAGRLYTCKGRLWHHAVKADLMRATSYRVYYSPKGRLLSVH